MSLLSLLTTVVNKKISSKPNDSLQPIKTDTPMGLRQGSIVTMPEIDIALAQADGSLINVPGGNQTVVAVGTFELFGLSVYNVYLNEKTFLQLVTKFGSQDVQSLNLWSSYAEIIPTSVDEWEFWLGSWQKSPTGEFLRDSNGVAYRKDWGLIGWPSFQIDGPPPIVYGRTWLPSNEGIDPVKFTESIRDVNGDVTIVKHEAVEYSRALTPDNTNTIVESLLASVSSQNDSASVNIWIGIPINKDSIAIIGV